jgi:hypothetical protein
MRICSVLFVLLLAGFAPVQVSAAGADGSPDRLLDDAIVQFDAINDAFAQAGSGAIDAEAALAQINGAREALFGIRRSWRASDPDERNAVRDHRIGEL